jgi:predicted kinase
MIELLIGPIASGKSTYSLKRAREGALIINDDAIVQAVHGGDYRLYDKNLKPLYKHIELSIMSLAESFDRDVVIDRPNLKADTRRRYIQIAKSLDIKDIRGIIFKNCGPEEHARRRFFSNNRGNTFDQWLVIAKHHDTIFERPDISEGFSSIIEMKDTLNVKEFEYISS